MSAAAGDEVIRRRVIYTGRVQGVCFRATTLELSRRRRVVGYVRNLPDGTVELEAEGPAAEVESLLADVAEHHRGYIVDSQRTALPARGDETSFEITY